MTGTISPFLRSPFTDITAGLISHQVPGSQCGDLELKVMECLEAYGFDRGVKICRCFIEDFKECQTHMKSFARFIDMRSERQRQINEGILKGDKKYMSPRMDSY